MTLLTASLYLLCLSFLVGSALYVVSRNPRSRPNRLYALLALSLICWVGSLLAFSREGETPSLLLLGRFNFAAVVIAATAAFLFVRAVADRPVSYQAWLWVETGLLTAVTLLTGGVDRAEFVAQARAHSTAYGPLFPLYLGHIALLLVAAVMSAFGSSRHSLSLSRQALRLMGWGILTTTAIGLVTNVLLPYSFGNFRLIDVGPLSTLFFLGTVGYGVFAYHLFSLRVIVRKALVLAGLVTLALELYQVAITFLSHLLPLGDREARGYAAAALALVVNAFTQQPVRRWLEGIVDRLFFRRLPRALPGRSKTRSAI